MTCEKFAKTACWSCEKLEEVIEGKHVCSFYQFMKDCEIEVIFRFSEQRRFNLAELLGRMGEPRTSHGFVKMFTAAVTALLIFLLWNPREKKDKVTKGEELVMLYLSQKCGLSHHQIAKLLKRSSSTVHAKLNQPSPEVEEFFKKYLPPRIMVGVTKTQTLPENIENFMGMLQQKKGDG